jgi:predicted nucleic acid-binding protein
VIDASSAVAASLATNGFDVFSGHELVAPALLWSEGRSALHELAWRGDVPRDTAKLALDALMRAPIVPGDVPPDAVDAWQIADQLGWAKTYDAEYVALARHLVCPLVTLDGRLRRSSARVIEVLAPGDW